MDIIRNSNDYQMLESGKIKCNKCGTEMVKTSWTRHTKSKKHIGDPKQKEGEKYQRMRETTKSLREKRIESEGLDAVREKERLKKRAQRLKKRAESTKLANPAEDDGEFIVHTVKQQPQNQTEKNQYIDDVKEMERDIRVISDKPTRLKLSEIMTKAREQKSLKKLTIPQTKKLMIEKIKKAQVDDDGLENCDKLVDKLDHKNLVNKSRARVERKTLLNYLSNINLVYKSMTGKNADCENFDWLYNTKAVEQWIKYEMPQLKTVSSIAQYFKSIYSILARLEGYEELSKEYRALQAQWNNKQKEQRGLNLMSEKERQNYLPWDEIMNYTDSTWTPESKFLFKLYTAIPPRRLDYKYLKLVKGKSVPQTQRMDKSFTYFVINKNNNPIAIVINNYKTKKKYGTFIVDLTQKDFKPYFRFSEIKKAFKDLFRSDPSLKSGELMFPNSKGNIYSDFSDRIQELFRKSGKLISVNLLRHSFITSFLKKNPNLNDNTLAKMAHCMGHSTPLFLSYRKLDEDQLHEVLEEDEDDDDDDE